MDDMDKAPHRPPLDLPANQGGNMDMHMIEIEADRPITEIDDDEFGFAELADKLAQSVAGLSTGEGSVFGIEGPWGSGKTSFLNFLRKAVGEKTDASVLTLSPWLIGDSRSLVGALIAAMAPALEAAELKNPDNRSSASKDWWGAADLLRGYAARTARAVSPLAKLTGMVIPGMAAVGEALGTGAEFLDGVNLGKSESDLKKDISDRIRTLDVGFVVMIDDLDRLEPAQAVEVVRLVRSVADFPNVTYVLCYDRAILAHALEIGLSVKDGDLFLQKIVQLSFGLPMPEPFDLRLSLKRKARHLYRQVSGADLDEKALSDLDEAINAAGQALRTPRDVKLVINGMRFVYEAIADQIYFPDLCSIHLLRVLHPGLHRWLDEYLSIRSALVSGDARVDENEKRELGERLHELLPADDVSSPKSISRFRTLAPGVRRAENAAERVFGSTTEREASDLDRWRRVGSPAYSRYYFALSAPKALLRESELQDIRRMAGEDHDALGAKFISFIEIERSFGRDWFSHMLGRMDDGRLEEYSSAELAGLMMCLAATVDRAIRKFGTDSRSAAETARSVTELADLIIRKLKRRDQRYADTAIRSLLSSGASLNWLVGYFFRERIKEHDAVASNVNASTRPIMTDEQFTQGKATLRGRVVANSALLWDLPCLSSFIWGWRDLTDMDVVRKWALSQIGPDERFVSFLLRMRGWMLSDRVYYPLDKKTVEVFMPIEEATTRLEQIKGAGRADLMASVMEIEKSLLISEHNFED